MPAQEYNINVTADDGDVDAMRSLIDRFKPLAIQEATDQATAAATSAAQAALYDGPKVDTFAELASVTPEMLSVGEYIRCISGGWVYQRADDGATDPGLLDYTGAGGVKLRVLDRDAEISQKEFGNDHDNATAAAALSAPAIGRFKKLNLGSNIIELTSKIDLTLTQHTVITANGGGYMAANAGAVSRLLHIDTAGYDLTIEGLLWDGDNKVPQLYRIDNTSGFAGEIQLLHNKHLNVFRELARDGQGGTDAVYVRGGFEKVLADDNLFKNVSREAGVGIPGSAGSTGLAVGHDVTTGSTLFAKSFIHKCNQYDTIDTEDTGADRADCDGVKYFTGEVADGDTTFIPTRFVSTGNEYKDCAGRGIKGQVSHGLVSNETIIRENVLSIHNGFSDINLQMGSGTVANIDAFYNEVGGLSPFTADGSAGSGSSVVSFYSTPRARESGSPTVHGVTVYNNVPKPTGQLSEICSFTTAGEDTSNPAIFSMSNCKVVGGAVKYFATAPVKGTGSPRAVVNMTGCYASDLTNAFIGVASGHEQQLFLEANGNINASGSDVLAAEVTYAAGTAAKCNVSGLGNSGVDMDPRRLSGGTIGGTVPLRTNTIFPRNDSTDATAGFSFENAFLADDETYTFRAMGYNSHGLFMVSANYTHDAQAVFGISGSGYADLTGGAASSFAFGSGSNPDTDGKINVWHDGLNLHIKNRLGSARNFLVGCFG
ncbi:hypothetical protein T8A63_07470 [Sulfitobacter sp. OXR-159]|uniref:hypothetical protein n=1 Tax=Sulfitobacter sp. OXR-159 TaxID=3100174 RepID=UPI002AC95E24|nr:hypothetical protein [Sulfitobacter sp. OXR-159]WPZ30795.1 hypothetical protein T8A63_06960 [Sulfitobacter sp. OXR-159]WPZ30896.1 hypothetical protein T8A63_07470 [Sulfitobacter sp. OXR-159]